MLPPFLSCSLSLSYNGGVRMTFRNDSTHFELPLKQEENGEGK